VFVLKLLIGEPRSAKAPGSSSMAKSLRRFKRKAFFRRQSTKFSFLSLS